MLFRFSTIARADRTSSSLLIASAIAGRVNDSSTSDVFGVFSLPRSAKAEAMKVSS